MVGLSLPCFTGSFWKRSDVRKEPDRTRRSIFRIIFRSVMGRCCRLLWKRGKGHESLDDAFDWMGVFALLVLLQAIVRAAHPVQRAIGGIVMGLCALVAVNLTGVFTGVSIPLSPLAIGVSGAAGIPGVDALAFAKPDLCIGKKNCQPVSKMDDA